MHSPPSPAFKSHSSKLPNVCRLFDLEIAQPSVNYTVGVAQHKLFARSNLGLIAINKEVFPDARLETLLNTHNRVLGFDYYLASKDNKWTGKFFTIAPSAPNFWVKLFWIKLNNRSIKTLPLYKTYNQ